MLINLNWSLLWSQTKVFVAGFTYLLAFMRPFSKWYVLYCILCTSCEATNFINMWLFLFSTNILLFCLFIRLNYLFAWLCFVAHVFIVDLLNFQYLYMTVCTVESDNKMLIKMFFIDAVYHPRNNKFNVNSYSASHDSWCTGTLINRIITPQWEGMGDVGSARYEPALLPPCPTIRVLRYSNSQRSTLSISKWMFRNLPL